MGCCCDQSELSGLYGLNGLMGALLAPGSQMRVGFAYDIVGSGAQIMAGQSEAAYIQNTLTGNLLEFGIFDSVVVTVSPPPMSFFTDGYILVQGVTRNQQNDPNNIGSIVERQIIDYLPAIRITRKDPVVIDAVPTQAQGRSDIAQPNWQQYAPQAQQGRLGECNWDQQPFGDYVACQLGISSPLGGVGVGAAGALIGVGVLTLLAVVLLRR
jgi:hypothetical protein